MKKNKNSNIIYNRSTAALVFDRYYGNFANIFAVLAQRMLIAAAISFFSISYIFSMYEMPVSTAGMSAIAAGTAVGFSLLFTVVKRRIAIPVITIVSGIVILSAFDSFWERFSYFIDGVILECNGRMLDTTASTIHRLRLISINGMYTSAYTDGVMFGCVILCLLFALITAAGVMGKPHILPSLSAFLILWIPKLISEKLFFGWQLIPLIALYAGMVAIGTYYRDGLAIRHVYAAGGYRRKVVLDDKRFNAAARAQEMGQRVAARGFRYSKYFSSVMSAVAMFTALGIVLSSVFKDSSGIDYTPFYEKLQSIGGWFEGVGSNTSPFKTGEAADYFTSPSGSIFKANNRLRLTSPSTGTKEIIRVTKPITSNPIYLRGDIGIEFDGVTWSSPVTEEPIVWKAGGIDIGWLPAEVIALAETANETQDLNYSICSYYNVSVEYLCDTDVIFAPAYDMEYGMFDPMYGTGDGVYTYGDFAARRKTDKATGETMEFIAAVPLYTDASGDFAVRSFGHAFEVYDEYVRTDDHKALNNFIKSSGYALGLGYHQYDYSDYIQYVNAVYLDVPEKMKAELDEFIESAGLDDIRERTKLEYLQDVGYAYSGGGHIHHNSEDPDELPTGSYDGEFDEAADRFLSAIAVADYLRSNYKYSLNALIDRRNPVMSFLNDTKSGHCALYASAMTLILREWGIPARYCTGFVANADLAMITLRSKDLHAWCEVYLDGMGWVTFDPTAAADPEPANPNSSSSSSSQPQSSVPSSSSDSSEESSDSSDSSESRDPNSGFGTHSGGGSDPGQRFTFVQFLPYLLIILAIGAVAVLTVFAVRAYIDLKKRAYKQVQSFHRERDSEYVYEKLLAVLRCCGLKPMNGEQPHEFFARAEETLECDICENYAILEKLAFGNNELDETERALFGRSFDKVFKAAENRFKLIGKVRLRLLVVSRKV